MQLINPAGYFVLADIPPMEVETSLQRLLPLESGLVITSARTLRLLSSAIYDFLVMTEDYYNHERLMRKYESGCDYLYKVAGVTEQDFPRELWQLLLGTSSQTTKGDRFYPIPSTVDGISSREMFYIAKDVHPNLMWDSGTSSYARLRATIYREVQAKLIEWTQDNPKTLVSFSVTSKAIDGGGKLLVVSTPTYNFSYPIHNFKAGE